MEEKMEKQEIRISSLEDQLKIQDIEIKDLKSKMLKFGPKIQEVEKSVTTLRKIIVLPRFTYSDYPFVIFKLFF
jgi:uncharacterized coiled-coil protein SlyX